MRSLIEPPPRSALARFTSGFGRRFLVTVDTEEEFDWGQPLARDTHGLVHVPRLARFQQFCESEGVAPVYLVDWPIAQSREAAEALRPPLARGKAEIGVQLNPWVNPPFEEEVTPHTAFAGNLPPSFERAKFITLRKAIERNFETAPVIYRAGRYGAGPRTALIVQEGGIAVDSSVRPYFDYSAGGGPDYGRHPLAPYWVDDAHTLLELPLTTVFWGLLRRQGGWLHPALRRTPRLRGALARLGLLERIPLTPEGISVEHAIRAIDIALDDGLPLLVFSFHSPSLSPGYTPYVRNAADLERLYDWWQRVFAYLELRDVRPTSVAEVMSAVERQLATAEAKG